MKKIIMFAIATILTIPVFAKPGDCKKCTKKKCTTECQASCTKEKCAAGICK